MIDIHSHVIFGVDDGPSHLEESVSLIASAYQQGVRTIVATSHRRKELFETPESVIFSHFEELKRVVAKTYPDLGLYYGAEIYYTPDVLDKLSDQVFPTLSGTQFVLIEFGSRTSWKDMHLGLSQLLMRGLTPVVAHIERYDCLAKELSHVREILAMGCYTQVNSVHVLKPKLFGDPLKSYKKRVHLFLDENLVTCVASDMHNLTERPSYLLEAYQMVKKHYGNDRAQALFSDHPRALLENQMI